MLLQRAAEKTDRWLSKQLTTYSGSFLVIADNLMKIWCHKKVCAPYRLSNTVISPIKTHSCGPFSSNRFAVIMQSNGVWESACVCTHTFKKCVCACASAPMCMFYIACNCRDIFNTPLAGPAGYFRVSEMWEGGNISMCGGTTEQTFAARRLYNPYLLGAGPAPWKQALPTMLMLMPPSQGGNANALIPDRPFLMYIITACVFGDGDSG